MTPDFTPAARQMSQLLSTVTDDQLDNPTPCTEYRLGDLVDHIIMLVAAFTAAARKDSDVAADAPSPDASRLAADWRDHIEPSLTRLAEAWADPKAWEGETRAGGLTLAGREAGVVALDELVIHGWDVARATGQEYQPDPPTLALVAQFVTATAEAPVPGLFEPPVSAPENASDLERVIALSGRDPRWRP